MGTLSEKLQTYRWVFLLSGIALVGLIFYEGILHAIGKWEAEEYSHSYLIPLVTCYLIWQQRAALASGSFSGSWIAVLLVSAGVFFYIVGELSTLYSVVQYAFIMVLLGIAWSFLGWQKFKYVAIPILLLFFTIPLPNFIYNNLSAQLQLISSKIGVDIIRAMGISVYLEGNVIDLGAYKLQVVEACSGLRYLFPLMSLGFICAYLFRQALWKRVLVFLSTIPITISMNSFRIGVIGWLVEHWGIEMAEGFLHDFEGWVVFMACFAILLLEMALLVRIGRDRATFARAFGIQTLETPDHQKGASASGMPASFFVSLALLLMTAVISIVIPQRQEITPERATFANFPQELGKWSGQRKDMELIYINALNFDDYILSNFQNSEGHSINLYVAYYDSQRKGQSAHSPRTCLPGGGWKIVSSDQVAISDDSKRDTLYANRFLIQYGDDRQLVYYWFKQRDRNITNEYLVKWFLFWDALTRNRTDGALIRLTTLIESHEDIESADRRLLDFTQQLLPEISSYVPD